MSNDVSEHEIELVMVLLNNRAVFVAAVTVLIVDIGGAVVIFDAVEMKRRIRSRTSNQQQKQWRS